MYLTEAQLQTYADNGFLLLPGCFSRTEMDAIRAELPAIFAEDSPRRVLEKESNVVRSVYGSHLTNKVAYKVSRHPRLLQPAMQIVGGNVYVYQFKVNAKAAFGGDRWEWHQDYIFWQNEDGMPAVRVVNVVIFLDEVNEFNGPLIFIPGSHKEGVISTASHKHAPSGYEDSPEWISNLTADLKYSLDKTVIGRLVEKHGMVAPKGPAGSLLIFHGNVVHGSAPNMSPFDRNLMLVTFNHVENMLRPVKEPRPEFLVSRDYTPIEPLSENVLLS